MDWLKNHAQVISALASSGMLLIWATYAWLFYQEFRRQRGSLLFIHEAGGEEPGSDCVLVNLSQEPVHVLCTMAASDSETVRLRDTQDNGDAHPLQRAKQGPLQSGESLLLGSFQTICGELKLGQNKSGENEDFEIRVAAIHGFREWPVGARRRFRLSAGDSRVAPLAEHTTQMRSKRQANEIRQWLTNCHDG